MAKVLGVMLSIVGGLAFLGTIFRYLNSSAYLSYNPATPKSGLLDVGLVFPFVLFGLMLLAGIVILKYSTEPESK